MGAYRAHRTGRLCSGVISFEGARCALEEPLPLELRASDTTVTRPTCHKSAVRQLRVVTVLGTPFIARHTFDPLRRGPIEALLIPVSAKRIEPIWDPACLKPQP